MVVIQGMPYANSVVYLKLAGSTDILSLPFCEALAVLTNVKYEYKASLAKTQESNSRMYIVTGDTDKEKGKTYTLTKGDMMHRLETDIYGGKFKIVDMAIQPEDELLVDEVKKLIGD